MRATRHMQTKSKTRRWGAFALAGGLFLYGAGAGAIEREPRVAVVSVRQPDGVVNDRTVRTREALEASLRKHRVAQVSSHPALRAADGSGATAGSQKELAKARKWRRAGAARYKKFDVKGAEKRLRAAAELFEENAGALTTPEDLVRTYLTLAEVFIATEREVLAREVFQRVVQLDPDLSLDVTSHPPRMVRVYQDVKAKILETPLGTMRVVSVPAGGTVFLDSKERGAAPITLRNIPTGVHVITVRHPGYAPWVRPVDVKSFRQESVVAALELDRHPEAQLAASDNVPDGVTAYLADVAATAELDLVLVGVLDGGKLVVRAWHEREPLEKSYAAEIAGEIPIQFDALIAEVLADAARKGWIEDLAARRRVAYGGGALDETRKMRIQVSFGPGGTLLDNATNVPIAPIGSLKITWLRRWRTRWLWAVETGFEGLYDSELILENADGDVVVDADKGLGAGYTTIPLDAGIRYYFGVRTLAPYFQATFGLRYDKLYFREDLRFDSFESSGGLGVQFQVGVGLDWALSTDHGVYTDLRFQLGSIGAGDIRHTVSTGTLSTETYPVEPGAALGVRWGIGYLRVF